MCRFVWCLSKALTVIALLVVFIAYGESSEHWDYRHQDQWPSEYCKTGKQQSPIALSQSQSSPKEIGELKLDNFDQTIEQLLVYQNGHTVVVEIPDNCSCSKPSLSGAGLTNDYTLQSFHFHWPSEHTIDAIQYDLETHFVFYATKYHSFEKAQEQKYGLTVLGLLHLKTNYTQSNNFRAIAEAAKKVAKKINKKVLTTEEVNLKQFLPSDYQKYFSYTGSLTTPNCLEYVNWIVLKNTGNIQHSHFQDLTKIYTEDGDLLEFNNRKLQDLNGRTVYYQG
ncbi:hypothetical protein GWI33_017018 [Rhynchophorus ferrugineus]|uniref:carbonic anhydrase n=1 Tax=Rhynchophorus ferrugineus TaxID=354439 RepID=A0A834M4E1_RHYFE|nr:hypothetical protein GWI33_017018 [Rhynchophorus ferrugineus]